MSKFSDLNFTASTGGKFHKFNDAEPSSFVFVNDEVDQIRAVFEGGKYRPATASDDEASVSTKYRATIAVIEGGKKVEKVLEQSRTFFARLQEQMDKHKLALMGTLWTATRVGTGKATAYLITGRPLAAAPVATPANDNAAPAAVAAPAAATKPAFASEDEFLAAFGPGK